MAESTQMEKIISLAKRRGFIYPGSEIYGGLAGTYDYGPLGTLLKENLKQRWLHAFRDTRDDIYGLDSAILMNPKVWEASGHVAGFSDPLVECEKCHHRFRADHLDESGICPDCGGALGQPRSFNLMFKTHVGAVEDESTVLYLRPETAGGIFVNFKNVLDTMHPKLPFGIAQIGKAFRNEIAPRDFIFRVRELEQMEMQYFIPPALQNESYEMWRQFAWKFLVKDLGIEEKNLQWHEHAEDEKAHYAAAAHDIYFNYPHGFKELWGTHNRTDFDLDRHMNASGVDLSYLDEESKQRFTPNVIESSVGVDRMFLAVLANAYKEDEMGGEGRTYLSFEPRIAPIKAMVAPLLKNKPELVEKAKEVRKALQQIHPAIAWDDNGNIGKRYRRQDEIGTPFCITVDFDTLGETPELKDTVTLRHRDTGLQERLTIEEVQKRLRETIE